MPLIAHSPRPEHGCTQREEQERERAWRGRGNDATQSILLIQVINEDPCPRSGRREQLEY